MHALMDSNAMDKLFSISSTAQVATMREARRGQWGWSVAFSAALGCSPVEPLPWVRRLGLPFDFVRRLCS